MQDKLDVFEIVNARILELLDQGVNPWRKPFFEAATGGPVNLKTGKPYRGVNVILLAFTPYASPYWLSYKQAQAMGGQVRKGEKSTQVVFWKMFEPAKEKALCPEGYTVRRIPMLRYYRVFNVEQIDGLEDVPPLEIKRAPGNSPIESAAAIVSGMPNPPRIIEREGFKPHYAPRQDEVRVPPLSGFISPPAYYSTVFHELAHATGHESRLNRAIKNKFGSGAYAREELIAEMASAYLCGLAGIADAVIENKAAYVNHWREVIANDKKAVVVAAGQAHKSAEYIAGLNVPGKSEPESGEESERVAAVA